jgi:ribosomal-protein-alanine N-acetyltransferase
VTWELRRASIDDLDALVALEHATFPSDAWSRNLMRDELTGPHRYYLVAVTPEADIVGYAGLLAPQGGGEADIQTVAVAASARRRGLGRQLVESLLAEARRRGASEVLLEVRADNPGAQQLYREFGFEGIATRPHYYQPDDVAALIMRLELASSPTAPATTSAATPAEEER